MLGALALLVSLAAAEPQADRIPVLLKHPHPTVEVEQAEVDCGDNPIVWKIVDDLKYDWNADGKPDVF